MCMTACMFTTCIFLCSWLCLCVSVRLRAGVHSYMCMCVLHTRTLPCEIRLICHWCRRSFMINSPTCWKQCYSALSTCGTYIYVRVCVSHCAVCVCESACRSTVTFCYRSADVVSVMLHKLTDVRTAVCWAYGRLLFMSVSRCCDADRSDTPEANGLYSVFTYYSQHKELGQLNRRH